MDKPRVADDCKIGDQNSSDVTVRLRNQQGKPEFFFLHSSILTNKSKFFLDKLSSSDSTTCIEIKCTELDYDRHVDLLRLLYLPGDSLSDALDCCKTAVGLLRVAVAFQCEDITQGCIQYLGAIPWEDKEEEELIELVSKLGAVAMPILDRIQPVDLSVTKNVFLSAVRFATGGGSCPPFGDELKTSAREQIEYMLGEDEDTPLVTADDEVKSEVKTGLFNIFSSFEKKLSSLLLDSAHEPEAAENNMLHSLEDLEWMCNILPKMDLMKDFVSYWTESSRNVLGVVEDEKLDSSMWGMKMKLIEVAGKALEAIGYGTVILPSPCRVQLLKTWLPYIRKMKPLLDVKDNGETIFVYRMNEGQWQGIEGAIVSLVLALPSNDQADVLTDWMKTQQARFPDLSEAFEIWCYRSKSAKRRLVEGLGKLGNATISL